MGGVSRLEMQSLLPLLQQYKSSLDTQVGGVSCLKGRVPSTLAGVL